MKTETDPNTIVYFENQYVPLAEARVNILTHALHDGTGVFEGIRAYWDDRQKEIFLLGRSSTLCVGRRTAVFCESRCRRPPRPSVKSRKS